MRNDCTSPVLRSSRSRHHKRKSTLDCTSEKPIYEWKHFESHNSVEEVTVQNFRPAELGSCKLLEQSLQGEETALIMEKPVTKLECPASGSSHSTPQQRKKQKCSFTPQTEDSKSISVPSSDNNPYSSALDDTLMTSNIECILEPLEVEASKNGDEVELSNLNEYVSKTSSSVISRNNLLKINSRSGNEVPQQVINNMCIEKPMKNSTNSSSRPLNRTLFLNETYTSPNRFQIKVRKKLSAEKEKYKKSNKSSSFATGATSSFVSDIHGSDKFKVSVKQSNLLQVIGQVANTNSSVELPLEEHLRNVEVTHLHKFSGENLSEILQDPDLIEAFDESFNLEDVAKDTKVFNQYGKCSPDLFADKEFPSENAVKFKKEPKICVPVCSSNKVDELSLRESQGKVPLTEIIGIPTTKHKSNTVHQHATSNSEIVCKELCKVAESKENIELTECMIPNMEVSEAKNPGVLLKELHPVEVPMACETPKCVQDAEIFVHSPNLLRSINETSKDLHMSYTKVYPKSYTKILNATQLKLLPESNISSVIKSPQVETSKATNTMEVISPSESCHSNFCSTPYVKSIKPSLAKVSIATGIKLPSQSPAKVYNTSHIKSPSEASFSKAPHVSSQAKSPGSNSSVFSTLESDCSTLQSQNLLQRMHGKLYAGSQSTPGSAHTTQLSTSLNTSTVLRNAAVTEAVQLAQNAAAPDAAVGHELGPFFGLPSVVLELFHKHRGITGLYDWQTECINQGLSGNNLLISLPTSGGKTLVAEVLMLRTLLVRKKHAIFLLPYVAIVQEKVRGLAPLAVDLDFLLEEYAGSRGSYPPKKRTRKSVAFVATTEKANGLISSFLEEGRAGEVGLVVVDEAHMLGEPGGRGALLESTITKLRHSAKHVQIVAMSATISNLNQLSEFLGAELYTGDFRPVKLRQFVKMNNMVSEINPAALTDEELLFNHRSVEYGYSSSERAQDPDGIAGLVREVIPDHSVLVFCPTRRNCESLAKLLCTLLPSCLTKHNRQQKESLYLALAKEGGGSVCPVLKRVLPYGLAYHHSGLTEGERKLIEEGYLCGTLCLITCTSTLAAGVNLPARRVILRSPYTGRDPLTRSRYMQMVGRAGRAGLDSEGESFLIMQQKDSRMIPNLVRGPVETCLSRLCDAADDTTAPYSHATARPPPQAYNRRLGSAAWPGPTAAAGSSGSTVASESSGSSSQRETTLTSRCGLRDLVFSSIGLGLVSNLAQALDLVQCSLMALQAQQRHVNLHSMVVDVLEKLRSFGMLRIKDTAAADSATSPAAQNKSQSSVCGTSSISTGLNSPGALSSDASQTMACSSASSAGSPGTAEYLLEDLKDPNLRITTALLPHHTLVVSRLGRAAIKGCIELSIASRLYEDLMVARNSLAVHSRLHLLYLVTPYSAAHELPLVPQAFYQAYCGLLRDEVQAAELIGVGEAVASKVAMGKAKTLSSEVVKRFNAAIILHRLLAGEDVWSVSSRFEVPRGLLQRTLGAAAAFASCVHHFCQELEELWAFRDLLVSFSRQLSGCCSAHLLPLMDLPAVKLGRARLMFSAGYTNLHAVANADPDELVKAVHHLPSTTAAQIVHSAKALLLEKAEALQEEAEQVLLGLTDFSPAPGSAASVSFRV